jgi:hypothetical protein
LITNYFENTLKKVNEENWVDNPEINSG